MTLKTLPVALREAGNIYEQIHRKRAKKHFYFEVTSQYFPRRSNPSMNDRLFFYNCVTKDMLRLFKQSYADELSFTGFHNGRKEPIGKIRPAYPTNGFSEILNEFSTLHDRVAIGVVFAWSSVLIGDAVRHVGSYVRIVRYCTPKITTSEDLHKYFGYVSITYPDGMNLGLNSELPELIYFNC